MVIKLDVIKKKDLEIIRQWRNSHKRFFRQYRDLTSADQTKWFNNNFDGSIMFGIYEKQYDINENMDINAEMRSEFNNKKYGLIGVCGLCYIDHLNKRCDLSIYIGETYIDKRALKALKLLFKYAFNQLGMETIFNDLFEYDERKKDILLKSGMKEEGRLRHRYYRDGKYHDAILFSILKDDWMEIDE
jgi:RimJ/RimL family protein N-acetyltransferase